MSTHIIALVPDNDPEYQKHKKIFDVCTAAEVSLPVETEQYFKGCDVPEEKLQVKLLYGVHYKEWSADMQEGFEVDITTLPQGVRTIRFYNSY